MGESMRTTLAAQLDQSENMGVGKISVVIELGIGIGSSSKNQS